MSQLFHTIPFGTSEPQDFLLQDKGQPIDGTGFEVSLRIAKGSTPVADAPTVDWLDQAAGTVRVTGCEVLAVGRYKVRFLLRDMSNVEGFVPNGDRDDEWSVVRVPPAVPVPD
jgi:hypothetical protein